MGAHRALIVEDNPETIDMIVDVLASLEHEYDTACSQEEALRRLKAREYSYVLLDIEIPAQSRKGPARIQNTENLLEKIGEAKGTTAPPVIIMNDHCAGSLDSTEDMMRLAMSMTRKGAADIIKKPFPKAGRTLDRVIKKALAGKRGMCDQEKIKTTARPPAVESAAGVASPDTSAPAPVAASTLTQVQLNSLEAVAESPQRTVFQAEIIAAGGYGKHATRQCLGQLQQLGLIHHPQGERKGLAVTGAGREFLARVK